MHSHLIHENPADYGGEASSRRAPSVARLQTWARPLAGARTPQEGARRCFPRASDAASSREARCSQACFPLRPRPQTSRSAASGVPGLSRDGVPRFLPLPMGCTGMN